MFKKTIIALTAIFSISASAEVYEFGKMSIEAEINENTITMQRCIDKKNCLIAKASIEDALLKIEAEEESLKELLKDKSKLYKDAKKQALSKIKEKKDLIKDQDETYVILNLLDNGITLPVNVKKLDGDLVTILDNVLDNKIISSKSSFDLLSKKLPADMKTEDYGKFKEFNDLFFHILKVQQNAK